MLIKECISSDVGRTFCHYVLLYSDGKLPQGSVIFSCSDAAKEKHTLPRFDIRGVKSLGIMNIFLLPINLGFGSRHKTHGN